MDLRREEIATGPVITGFSGRGFKVGDQVYPAGLLIDPGGVMPWVAPEAVALLAPDMLGSLLEVDPAPEFLLLGTGPRLVQPPRAFVAALEARGIGVEAMDSRAAARAWGVLRQEDRQIVAALFPL
ncbi:MAG TPA: Mth938-like domain-containing protein [Sphingobium sp.]|nr:Mth938-like domain-containing protein [Sphingobium sp.]